MVKMLPSLNRKYRPMSGLSQSDFRRLLETPRVVAQQKKKDTSRPDQPGVSSKKHSLTGEERKAKYKRLKQLHTKRDESDPTRKDSSLDPTYQGKYRDRAAERRAGINPDYSGNNAWNHLEDI
jgi:hypothetical protein